MPNQDQPLELPATEPPAPLEHAIPTPALATFALRVGAFMVDFWVLQVVLTAAILLGPISIAVFEETHRLLYLSVPQILLTSILLTTLGRTFGMMLLGLRVENRSGQRINFAAAVAPGCTPQICTD